MFRLPDEATMYRALAQRDSTFDGIFWVGVRSTGVFCRPTCGARKPKRVNCEFFPTATAALSAGFRPCLRCRPLEFAPAAPEWLARLRRSIDAEPSKRIRESELRRMRLNPDRVRRQFRRHYGMTLAQYQRARALGTAVAELRGGRTVLQAALDSGFESEAGFREAYRKVFGDAPGRADAVSRLLCEIIRTPLGPMLAIASANGLTLLEFIDRPALLREIAELRRRFRASVVPGTNAHLERVAGEVEEYFSGDRRRFSVALDAPGSAFQRRVWDALGGLDFGRTTSYAELAKRLNVPGGARAIGRATGSNRIAIVIPCHRVVRSDGELAGYGGGLWRKRWLLSHERAASGGRANSESEITAAQGN